MANEVKIVINLKDGRDSALIGISKPTCDPIFATAIGGWGSVVTRLQELLDEAEAKWAENPRNPKCETPLPSQEVVATRSTTSRPAQTTPKQNQRALF